MIFDNEDLRPVGLIVHTDASEYYVYKVVEEPKLMEDDSAAIDELTQDLYSYSIFTANMDNAVRVTKEDVLSTCPWCGSRNVLLHKNKYVDLYCVRCRDCFARGPMFNKRAEAILAWGLKK